MSRKVKRGIESRKRVKAMLKRQRIFMSDPFAVLDWLYARALDRWRDKPYPVRPLEG